MVFLCGGKVANGLTGNASNGGIGIQEAKDLVFCVPVFQKIIAFMPPFVFEMWFIAFVGGMTNPEDDIGARKWCPANHQEIFGSV